MPGSSAPLFDVPAGKISVGLGIHGEPGIHDTDRVPASELATVLADGVLAAAPTQSPGRVAVIVNGLGTTKYEELFLLYRHVAHRLADRELEIVEPEVGELVTSLDMGGCSLTVMWLDDELDRLWRADAYAPGYRKQRAPVRSLRPVDVTGSIDAEVIETPASPAAVAAASLVRSGAVTVIDVLRANEAELGRLDAVAGDGDHGRGMVRGAAAARAAIDALPDGAGVARLLRAAGRAWATNAGGTSGVLWGAGLEAAAEALGDAREQYDSTALTDAVVAFAEAITQLGGAEPGDKTIVDALLPFRDALAQAAAGGDPEPWVTASRVADGAALATAPLSPRRGRARPLAARSVGTPDPGATSFALLAVALGARSMEGAG
jgi:dihydroxyacetone kinase